MMNKVLVIDLNNIWMKTLYVCNYDPEDHLAYILEYIRKIYTSGIYSSIYLVVDGDSKENKNTYAKYKEGRHKKDGSYNHLRAFVSIVCKYVKVLRNKSAEGDSVIAQLALYLIDCNDKVEVTILSNDKDFLQLVQYGRIHVADRIKNGKPAILTDEEILNKFKNSKKEPLDKIENILKYRVFKGDSSDKIPSAVKGLKDSIIRQIINLWKEDYLDEDVLMQLIGRVKDKNVQIKLIENKNNILRNYKLMNLSEWRPDILGGTKYMVPKINEEELKKWKVKSTQIVWL